MSAKRRVRETSEPATSVRHCGVFVLCGIRLKSVKKGRLSTRSHDTVWRVTTPSRPSNRCCTHHNSHGKCTRGNPRDAHVQIEDQGGRTARRRRSRSRGHCVSDAPPSPPSASASFCTVNKHRRSFWKLLENCFRGERGDLPRLCPAPRPAPASAAATISGPHEPESTEAPGKACGWQRDGTVGVRLPGRRVSPSSGLWLRPSLLLAQISTRSDRRFRI